MDFYDQQSSKRWQSVLLLAVFVLVLCAIAALIHLSVAAFSMILFQGGSLGHPSKPAIFMIVIVWLIMIAGGAFRWMDVRSGSAVLARRFGAVRASDRARHEKEKQLLNVVAEVSIAANTLQPDVFVLRHESGVNAFVLGSRGSRPVIVVTNGALQTFDREQLQAVIAHEFAHINNGDIPLNMRLLMVMGALMAIDEVGRIVLARGYTDRLHPGTLLGNLLCALGQIGVFAGGLVSAAFSRQREYLADACAVQYTRNPFALAAALDVIDERQCTTSLCGIHAKELSHLCFQTTVKRRWFQRIRATHPSLSNRIAAIEPHFHLKKRKAAKQRRQNAKSSIQAGGASPMPLHVIDSQLDYGDAANSAHHKGSVRVSDRVTLLLPDTSQCLAALFALFVYEDDTRSQENMSALGVAFNDEFLDSVRQVISKIPDELKKDQLSVIVHASSILNKKLNPEQRHKVANKLEQVMGLNNQYHLMDYARIQLIRQKLHVDFPLISKIVGSEGNVANARKVKRFDAMGKEFALLLSIMVESSGASPSELDAHFYRVLKCYTQQQYARRTGTETGIVKELEAAFQTLYVQPKPIRRAFVQHCVEIMQHDGYVMPTERAILDLFAASLGCEELIAA